MGETNIHKTHKSQITYKPRSKIANQTQWVEFETIYWTHANVINNWYCWGSLESLHVIQQNSWWKLSGTHSRRSFDISLHYVRGLGWVRTTTLQIQGMWQVVIPTIVAENVLLNPPVGCEICAPEKKKHQNHTWGLKFHTLRRSRLTLFT